MSAPLLSPSCLRRFVDFFEAWGRVHSSPLMTWVTVRTFLPGLRGCPCVPPSLLGRKGPLGPQGVGTEPPGGAGEHVQLPASPSGLLGNDLHGIPDLQASFPGVLSLLVARMRWAPQTSAVAPQGPQGRRLAFRAMKTIRGGWEGNDSPRLGTEWVAVFGSVPV